MLNSIKRLSKHTLIYGIGYILSRSIGFLLLPIHSNLLEPAQLGTAALLYSSLALINIVFGYGMDVAFLRFFILEESEEERKSIFSTAFLMILSTGILFSLLILSLAKPIAGLIFQDGQYFILIRLASGILLSDALILMPFLVLRGMEKSVRFGVLKFMNVAVNFGMNILFVVILKKGVPGIFTANLIASSFTLITVLPVILRWLRLRFNTAHLKELLRFGLPYIPSLLSVMIMDQISRFFLDRMAGKEITGIFSACYKLGMIMALVVAAFRFAWHPFFLSTSKEENAPEIFSRIFTYFMLTTCSVFLFISMFVRDIISIKIFGITLLGPKFIPGLPIVPVILLAYIAYGAYVNFIVGIYLKKKTSSLPLITGLGAAVSLLANYLLIPLYGIMGAAWASFLAYFSMAAALFIYSSKLYPVPYEIFRIVKILIVSGVLFLAGGILFSESHVLIRTGIFVSLFPALWILDFFKPEEKRIILSKLRLKY